MSNNPKIQAILTGPNGLAYQLQQARGATTGREFSKRAGWPPSKISKIELGQQWPSEEDLVEWARVAEVDDARLREWQALLHAAEASRRDLVSQVRAGNRAVQRGINRMIEETKQFRFFETTFIPRFLQTPEYTRAVLTESHDRLGGADDIDQATAERQASVRYLYDPQRRFEFLLTEQVLRMWPAGLSIDSHRAQLDRLLRATRLTNVRLGVVPLDRPVRWLPQNSFVLFDDVGFYETWTQEPAITLDDDVARHRRVLDVLWESAVEGDAAEDLIARIRTSYEN